ncbi:MULTISPECIES: amino acid ABC transporter ATP-binding protein [unclassified Enterococcus]|uniref:amino acid ABC transporter ATP-binding protein n=1 Tax=unclassified Enterococcus TaxID=2608891 RepID=UPI0015581F68|nr:MULTISPECIES: amino acid ABC transporter ATP-binding protein [unclassified Enterococcus]MBS7576585.1 amino acid ABC transporter ATP-binding protein [Enterococcus sp. MMGLQ5-2]MBS7583928.1 amino acid ABC transporter ATP-binding protein [Enterococcus sp. MMGLQ5-1]NPD11789.1 amino acid ABC transporter ATP-binding protein [Enterococcus sp. MMGLQ5-1]NPD36422.1 amino acid ABC transporter ATP-binding protein [Enterococcus sp. MMGLQ5-2]
MFLVENLTKKFHDNVVLDNLTLSFERGDVIALIGSSGAGKSTFLRSLNYLEKPDNGCLTLENQTFDFSTIKKQEILELRQQTAMVFQQFNLFERKTALENVKEGLKIVKKLSDKEAGEIASFELDKVGLSDRKNYFPKHLSGGQKQRVGIARALAMNPKLLLLDEPTSALDPELVTEVQMTIQKAAKEGQTMLLVSHEMAFVREVATKVIFLENGQIIESGLTDDVFNRPENVRTREFLSQNQQKFEPEFVL